jgi:hypothetical protein
MGSASLTTSRRLFLSGGIAVFASAFLPSIVGKLSAQEASLTGAQFRASGKTAKIQIRSL